MAAESSLHCFWSGSVSPLQATVHGRFPAFGRSESILDKAAASIDHHLAAG